MKSAEGLAGSLDNVVTNLDSANLMDEEMSDKVLKFHTTYLMQVELMPQKLVLSLSAQKIKIYALSVLPLGMADQFLMNV